MEVHITRNWVLFYLLESFLTDCQNWFVDKTRQDNFNYDSIYDGYNFEFNEAGIATAFWNNTSATGTWSTSGIGNSITVTINIPELSYCNNVWSLQEIRITDSTRVDLRVNTEDRIRYNNTCN